MNNTSNSFLSQFEGKSPTLKEVPKATTTSKIKAPTHNVVTDTSYQKRKMMKLIIIGASAIVTAILLFFGIRMANAVEIMDFTGTNWSSATQWALANGVTIQRNDAYNLEFDEGYIFDQNLESGSSMQRGSVIVLSVSAGADMHEIVDLPNFEELSIAQLQAWRRDMRMGNSVQVREEYHDDIEAGRFLSLDHPATVELERFTRSNSLTVVMSRGPRTLSMPNFVGRELEDAEDWAETNNIQFTIVYEVSEREAGEILAQSVDAGSRFAHDDEVTLTVAREEAVLVPNFSGMTQEEAMEVEGMTVIRRQRFSTTVSYGRLIEQSITPGTELPEGTTSVTVTFSLGRPFMENLVGQSEGMLQNFFFDNFTRHGAGITYGVRYVDSYAPRGEIVGMSRSGEFIGMNDHITIDISRGNLTQPEPEPIIVEVPVPVPVPYVPDATEAPTYEASQEEEYE